MYGIYGYPFHIENSGITIDITEENGLYHYKREGSCGSFETFISPSNGRIHITPVEPVNLPKNITRLLEIEFERILISPHSEEKFFMTFPIEIGIFLESINSIEVVDLFSLANIKYSLYGTPTNGEIVRYHKSSIRKVMQDVDSKKEGVLELNLINNSDSIASVSKIVLDGYGMKIYYDKDLVSMNAQMKIYQKNSATTEFLNLPLLPDMNKSIELYMMRNISVLKKYYTMEWGFD
ncbi:MAG: DUF432 domain-containing protein [Methanomicrobium sp.]|nr:DUF432 domain-containing protein [Methanomicrobium sp.]